MAAELSWWQKPLVILAHAYDYQPTFERGRAAMQRAVRWKRSSGFDAEHVLLNYTLFEGRGGDDARAYLFKNRYGYRQDWLGEYLPIARKHGLRVIVYFNCHWFKPDTFPADHYVVDASGKPKTIYGDGGEVCCRGPFRDWSEQIAVDLGRYPIDGVFLDGPVKDNCWCPTCRAAFQAQHGRPLPESAAACPPEHLADYQAFVTSMATGYLESFARGLQTHNPSAILYCNGGDAAQMHATRQWTHLIGTEGGFIGYRPLAGEFPFNAGLAAKRLEHRAHGRGRVVFCDSGFKVYDYHVHPRGEVSRMYAATIANGASPWFLVYRPASKAAGTQAVFQFNRIVAEHRAALTNGESLATAAVLESPFNLQLAGAAQAPSGDDVHRRDAAAQRLAVAGHGDEFNGMYAALARSGYPFDVVDERLVLDGQLPGRVKLLVLPGVSAMSDALAERLRRFVADGGRLLATFDTSLYDEHGLRRTDFALADVFGCHATGDLVGPSNLDYLGFARASALTAGIEQPVLPGPEHWQLVRPSRGARALLYHYGKMPRRYAALPPLSKDPAVLLHRFGKGQAMLIPSRIGRLSLRYRFPDIRRLLRNAARSLVAPPVDIDGGDEFIEPTLRRGADGAVVLHLINWATGERPSSGAVPLGPLRVTVRLPRGTPPPRSATLAMAGKKVKAQTDAGRASFVLPRIDEYEMVILR